MIVGESLCLEDIVVNVCKKKYLINMCLVIVDEVLCLILFVQFLFEECIEFLVEDEFLEVILKSLRFRKKILNYEMRKKMELRVKKEEKEFVF